MKKIGIVLAIIVALTLVVGCASSGGSSGGSSAGGGVGSGGAAELSSYSVDLNTLPLKRNAKAFTKQYDDLLIPLSIPVDVTKFKRVTINCKYYNDKSEEITPSDGKAMVTLVYDPKGDLRGPEMGPGKNTPLKEMNIGGFSGLVNTEKGVRINLSQPLGAILFQNSDASVKFIEVTDITFHN